MTDATLRALEAAARSPNIAELLTFWVREVATASPSDPIALFLWEGERWVRFLPEATEREPAVFSDSTLAWALSAGQPVAAPWDSGASGAILCRFAGRDSWRGVLALFPDPARRSTVDPALAQDLAVAVGRSVTALRRAETSRLQAIALERARLAAELHDGLLQSLLSAKMQAEICAALEEDLSPELPEALRRTHDVLGSIVVEARRFLLELRLPPENVEEFVPWLHEYAEDFAGEYGIGVDVRVEGEGELSALQAEEATRLMREALANVRKHARARSVRILLAFGRESATLSVSDDGVGFDLKSTLERVLESSHNGLMGMQYRAESIGGEMRVKTEPGKGATVTFRFPQKQSRDAYEIRRGERPNHPFRRSLRRGFERPSLGDSVRDAISALRTLFLDREPAGSKTRSGR